MTSSACIMLIPDETYVAARPNITEHHLTVAFFGSCRVLTDGDLDRLRLSVNTIARQTEAIPAKANGVGLFDAGRDGFALVDLIDGIGTFKVRTMVERLYGGVGSGPRVNYTHGFTPHITRRYYEREDDFYFALAPEDIDGLEFTFNKIGLWAGDEHYEVSL